MVWHVTLATSGAWLLYRMAEPLRRGDLFYVNWFIWSVLGGSALLIGGVGGLIEGWLLGRRHTVLAAISAAVAAFVMFSIAVVFAGRLANTVRYAVTPDTYLVPLTGWLIFMAFLTAVALRGAAEPRGPAALSSGPSDSVKF